jgi:RNA polymerase subunit RPABC4/transcription elongation factor Spt4
MRGRTLSTLIILTVLALALVPTATVSIIVGTAIVEGQVSDEDELPMENVSVMVVGMEEFTGVTNSTGHYLMVVPFLEMGHTLKFIHTDKAPKEASTGPLVEDGTVTVNVTLREKPAYATLNIRVLPWDQPGSNYGLRQDVMTVANASGTPFFEWSEKSSEEVAIVPAPGSYVVTGSRPGYYDVVETITVLRGQVLTVDLDKKPTYGVVNGSVEYLGLPVEGVTIIAEPENGTRTYQAVTDVEGTFSMQLSEGNYTIRVEAEGFARLSEGVKIELGKTKDVNFPMSVAQETGEEGDPWLTWVVLTAVIIALAVLVAYAMVTRRRTAAEEAAGTVRKDELRCPACEDIASADADSCAACGEPFPWKSFRCPDCGAVMELDANRCPECGNETFDLHGG